MQNLLEIVILARDRPIFLKKAIESLIRQTPSKVSYEIIISDNSESDNVQNLLKEKNFNNTKIKYKRRSPTLSSREHFKIVIEEFTAKYSMIFHDDDILHQDYLKFMFPLLLNESTSAVSCNAIIFNKEINDGFKKMHEFNSIKKFASKKDFLTQYLVGNGGIAPFSGYIFKTNYLKQVSFEGLPSGKHADVVILSSLIEFGQIVWQSEALMYYRVHSGSDSASEVVVDRLSLLRYMYSNGINKQSKSVFLFRYFYWFNWLIQKGLPTRDIFNWRYRKASKFIFFSSPRFIFSKYFMKTILRRVKNKLTN